MIEASYRGQRAMVWISCACVRKQRGGAAFPLVAGLVTKHKEPLSAPFDSPPRRPTSAVCHVDAKLLWYAQDNLKRILLHSSSQRARAGNLPPHHRRSSKQPRVDLVALVHNKLSVERSDMLLASRRFSLWCIINDSVVDILFVLHPIVLLSPPSIKAELW